MFSGLGNLDLNATFNQFSSTFSLDDLQGGEKPTDDKESKSHVEPKTSTAVPSKAPNASYNGDLQLAQDILKLRDQLKQKDGELNDLVDRFQDNTKLLQVEKRRNDELDNKLHASLSENKQLIQSEKVLTDKVRELERKIEQLSEDIVNSEQEQQEKYNQLLEDFQSLQNKQSQEGNSVISSDDGMTSTASEESNAKLAIELKNAETALVQAKAKADKLDKQLTKSKATVTEAKARLTTSEDANREAAETASAALKELQNTLNETKEKLTESQDLHRELVDASSAKQKDLQSSIQTLGEQLTQERVHNTDLTAQIAALNEAVHLTSQGSEKATGDLKTELQTLTKKFEVTSKQIETLTKEKTALEAQITTHKATISTLNAELDLHKSHSTSSSSAIEESSKRYAAKETQCAELEVKVASLTEKIKEVMQRFVDTKAKLGNTEMTCDAKIAEMAKTTQAKESEVISLRLKLENIERHSSDTRLKTGELAERYGEAQKELTRQTQNVKDLQAKIDSLGGEITELTTQVTTLTEERDNVNEQLQSAMFAAQQVAMQHGNAIAALQDEIANIEQQHKSHVAEYELELSSAQTRLKTDTESADVLDGYKKRAQVALKKANASTALLTQENERLKAQLETNNDKVSEVEGLLVAAEQREEVLNGKIATLELELSNVRAELHTAVSEAEAQNARREAALKASSDSNTSDYEEMYAKTRQLETTIALLQHDAAASKTTIQQLKTENAAQQQQSLQQQSLQHQNLERSRSNSSGAATTISTLKLDIPASLQREASTTSWARSAARPQQTPHGPSHDDMLVTVSLSRSNSATDLHAQNGQHVKERSSDHISTGASGVSILVSELQSQLEHLKRELSQRGIDIEASRQELQYEREEKKTLKNRVEELLAFLERTKQLHEGPDSAINMEYLKNCILKFMESGELSEKQRLFPVIATILKLTTLEKDRVSHALHTQAHIAGDKDTINPFGVIGSVAESFWGFGSAAVLGGTAHTASNSMGGMQPIKISNSRQNLSVAGAPAPSPSNGRK